MRCENCFLQKIFTFRDTQYHVLQVWYLVTSMQTKNEDEQRTQQNFYAMVALCLNTLTPKFESIKFGSIYDHSKKLKLGWNSAQLNAPTVCTYGQWHPPNHQRVLLKISIFKSLVTQ